MTSKAPRALLLFHQDLRLEDNPALHFAKDNGWDVLGLYVLDDSAFVNWKMGGASRWWLHHSLEKLREDCARIGMPLVVRRGATLACVRNFIKKFDCAHLLINRAYDPFAVLVEKELSTWAQETGVESKSFNSALLVEPWELKTQGGGPFQVFTPFWKRILTLDEFPQPRSAPKKVSGVDVKQSELGELSDLELLPKIAWDKGFDVWTPGEAGAWTRMRRFLNQAADYESRRDFPSQDGTSGLSPHLHFGEISPRSLWHECKSALGEKRAMPYLRELGWREFSHHLLYHFPKTLEHPLRSAFEKFPWVRSSKELKTWQRGLTGYPIVDAGMRQLWTTGWMHNRVRMIVGSFLVKHLRHSWLEGAHWFWDTLVDADLAQNTVGWQWVGGCGADAAPYFRIFNPVLQSRKFDAQGGYIRRWVPELAPLDDSDIHAPWEAKPEKLGRLGFVLGKDYPFPMVDHAEARKKALAAFQKIRAKA